VNTVMNLRRGSSEDDSDRGPSKQDFRESQMKKTPVDGRA
jgi:hypothetical protein